MSSSEESGSDREACGSGKKSCPSSSSTSSPAPSPSPLQPSTDTSLHIEEGSDAFDIKASPVGFTNNLAPDGVLTPPNDTESQASDRNGMDDGSATGKSNGRLAFFKG